jgi:transcriptional regulator with XRE-family HTH domain
VPSACRAEAKLLANSLHDARYKRLIELLATARKQAGLTQRDVAARLKQPPSYIGKLESRQRRIDLIELIDLLEAIGLKPGQFIGHAIAEIKRKGRD